MAIFSPPATVDARKSQHLLRSHGLAGVLCSSSPVGSSRR
jgi:hypothetical protein